MRGRGADDWLSMKCHDVLLGDAAAESGAGDLRETDAVLAGDFADQRGGAGFFVALRLRAGGGGRRWRWSGGGVLFFAFVRRSRCGCWRGFGAELGPAASPSTAMVPTTVFTRPLCLR